MNDWKDGFLAQVLSDVPEGRYRDRLAGELSGHLDALAADLEAGGASPAEARALALEKMGDREALRRSCRDEYRRREANDPLRCLGVVCMGFALMTSVSFLLWSILFFLDDFIPWDWEGIILLDFLFLAYLNVPPVVGAVYYRWSLRGHDHPRRVTIPGLLLPWLSWQLMLGAVMGEFIFSQRAFAASWLLFLLWNLALGWLAGVRRKAKSRTVSGGAAE